MWMAGKLAKELLVEVAAVYAGLGKSGLFRDSEFNAVEREVIKTAVKSRDIRIVVVTDTPCQK